MLKKYDILLISSFLLAFVLSGCGKKGDPLPPMKHLPFNLYKMQVSQQGEKAVITLTVPRTTQGGKPFEKEDFGKLEIYCLPEKDTGEQDREFEDFALDEEKEQSQDGTMGGMVGGAGGMKVIGNVGGAGGMPGDLPGWQSMDEGMGSRPSDSYSFSGTGTKDIFPRDVFERKSERVFVVEQENLDQFATGWRFTVPIDLKNLSEEDIYEKRLFFAVKLFNSKGQDEGLSSLVDLAPKVVPNPPGALKAEASQEAVILTWEKPDTMADGTALKDNIGYLVFRSMGGKDFSALPLNAKPLKKTQFRDASFRFNKTYDYMVRTAIISDKGYKESEDSTTVSVKPVDIFPPVVPAGLNSVKGEGEITLIWSPNLENDLDGYRVYRSIRPDDGFLLLNDLPLKKNAFTDQDVEAEKTYYYKVTAMDTASPPNESDFSEAIAEKLS